MLDGETRQTRQHFCLLAYSTSSHSTRQKSCANTLEGLKLCLMLMNCISALDPLHFPNMHFPMLNTEINWPDNAYQHSDDTQLFVDGALLLHPVIQYLEKTNYKMREGWWKLKPR